MHAITCPHCKKAFEIDEAGYANILKQVRDDDFEHQLHERLELADRDKQSAVELATIKVQSELQKQIDALQTEINIAKTDKQTAIQLLEAKQSKEMQKTISLKETEIQEMKSKLNTMETEQRHAIREAVHSVELNGVCRGK